MIKTSAEKSFHNKSPVKSIAKEFGFIKAMLDDGSTVTYGKTIKIEGVNRVLGVIEKDGVESLVSGVIVADENVNTSDIDPVGTYTGVMGGDILYEEPLDYALILMALVVLRFLILKVMRSVHGLGILKMASLQL